MATSINGSLGQTNNYSTVNDLITKWPTAAQNQGIKLFGIAFDGFETDYLDPTVISNLTLPTNENPKSWLSYGSSAGIGVPSSYDGWFTDTSKIRAEINYNPNTNQSQTLKLKWADNQDITSTTIDLSALSPKTIPGVGDQGNEVGLLQIFNNGVLVPASNFTITRVNAPIAPKPITVSSDGVTFIGDQTDGSFKFKIDANPLSGVTFDELRFSTKAYDSPTDAYVAAPFKDDSSDYLVRNIEYQGTEDPVSLQFSAPTFSVNENGTPVAAVTVTRVGSSAGTASATVNLANGTATAPGDYNNAPIVVNFANGDSTPKTIVIPIVDDTLVEGNEIVNLSLTNPTGSSRVTLGTQSTATLNIVDNDIPGSLQFSAPTYSVREDGTPIAAVRVSRTGGSAGAVSATVNLTDGTATAPGDYTNTPVIVNFAAGDTTTKTVVIPIVNDTLVEANETVNLSLGSPTGGATIGTQSTASLSVIDNDSTLQFSTPTYSIREDGTPIAAVRVTRTGSSAGAVSATVSTTDGTATAPGDYTNTPVVVNFANGDTVTKTVIIPIVNDTLVESNETVNLTLGTPTGNASIGTQSTATLNIIDNDSSLQFTAPTYSVREDGTPVATVSVSRTGSSAGAVSATVNLTDGTATAPGDYTGTPIVVNFANGDTASKTVTIPIINDTLVEGNETVSLTLGSPTGNASIGTQSTATLSILDNDSSLQFSAPTYSVNEDGTTIAAVRVTRTGASAGAVSATVNLTDGTATAPGDYTATPIVVNFANGDTAPKTVLIPIANDTLLEGTENISLTLASPTGNATIGTQSTATLNVIDNDSLLQFSNPTFSVNEDGTPIAAVRVTRTGASTGAVSATVGLTDGTAISPADYTNTPIVVNFATGDVSPKTVIIPIANDALLEGTENISLTLGTPTGNAAIGAQSTATLNIVDNESALQFSNPTFSVSEDGTPIAAVRVTRTGSSAGAASATVNLANGTATSPGDYTNTPVVVNFAAGDLTPKTVIIPLVNDTLVEGTETVSLTLASPTGNGTIGTQSTATLNVVDNDSSLQFSNPTFTLNEDGTPVAAVRVTRTGSSAGAVSATVSATDGTATSPADYTNSPVTVNFAAGDLTPKTVLIPIAEDTLAEGTENVSLTLASPTGNAAIGTQSTAILNIIDNDSTLQFSAPTFTVNENGTPVAAVRVTRTGASTGAVSATVSATDGTATAPGDYTNTPVVVNFAAGDTAVKTVIIPIAEDLLVEGPETVSLTLGSPTGNASIGTQSTATLNIVDNDVAPPAPIAPLSASAASSGSPEGDATMRTQSSITANAADNDVAPSKPVVSVNSVLDPIAGEASTPEGNGLFQFARTGSDLSQPLTIRYTTTGTATPGEDYAALLGTVTIDAGKSVSNPVTISPTSDLLNEPTESVIVKVAEDPTYQVNRVGSADTASVSILDDNPLKATASDSVLLYNSSGSLVGGFSNITNAVAASNPNDIIVAKAGTYDEPGTIVINKPLTLRGPNGGISPSGTRLSEAVVRTTALDQPVFQIAPFVNNVTIEGLTIQMNGSNAIQHLGFGTDVVIRQNTLTGIGPNSGSVISLDSGIPGFGSAAVIDNLIQSVSTTVGSNTNGIEASRFDTVRITDNQIANLTGSGIVVDSITEFGLPSVINSNKVSNVGQDGIRLQGGNTNIENNDITNANTSDVLTKGGIRLQDSSLLGGSTLGTVDVLSNFITNSVNGVTISNGISTSNVRVNDNNFVGNSRAGLLNDRSVAVDATENWWDSLTGPIVGGTGPNRIAGANANLVASKPFSTSIL